MRFELKRENKTSIFGELNYNNTSEYLLILVHGFKGFYSWGFFPEIKKRFLAHRCAVLSFNFSHNGVYRHGNEITEFDTFSQNNFTTEQEDFNEIINYTKSDKFPFQFKSVFGLGHSRGGAALLLAASNNTDYFSKIITFAAISHIHHRIDRSLVAVFKKQGYMEAINGRTGDILKVGYQFQNDLDANYDDFDIPNRVKEINCPVCIIHGDNDETVPLKDAFLLQSALNNSNENMMKVISGGSHTFNFDKQKDRLPSQLNDAIIQSLYFLNLMGVNLSN